MTACISFAAHAACACLLVQATSTSNGAAHRDACNLLSQACDCPPSLRQGSPVILRAAAGGSEGEEEAEQSTSQSPSGCELLHMLAQQLR